MPQLLDYSGGSAAFRGGGKCSGGCRRLGGLNRELAPFSIFGEILFPIRRFSTVAILAQSSVYFALRPLALSTGYLAALWAILRSMAAATSMPVMFANSKA